MQAGENGCIAQEVNISQEQFAELLKLQQSILLSLSTDFDKKSSLAKLCSLAESMLPNSVASIMLVEKQTGLMSVLSAPSIPQQGIDALRNLKPGPGGGSCGNAVFRNEPIFVRDTFSDEKWQDLRQVAYDFNICSCWSMPIRDSDGKPLGTFALSSFEHRYPSLFHKMLLEIGASLVGVILKKDEQEAEIKDKQESLRLAYTAIENTVEAIIMTDAQNNIIMCNASAQSIYGYSKTQMFGNNPKIFASGKHDSKFYKDMWDALLEKGVWSGEIWNKRANGDIFPQLLNINTVYDENKQPKNYVAIMTDISAQKNTEEKLESLNHNLEEIVAEEIKKSREKDSILIKQSKEAAMGEMLSSIAHHWRQPLNIIGVTVQDVKEAWKYGEVDETYINNMVESTMKHLYSLSSTIDNFRNLFKSDTEKTTFNVKNSIEKVVALVFAGQDEINYSVSIPDNINIYGVENEFLQTVVHLIKNAKETCEARHTKDASIKIHAGSDDNCKMTLFIEDNCGGISADAFDRIFEPYFTTKEVGKGSGIGLYMVKTIIEEIFGGKVYAKNINDGAEFVIELDKTK